MDLPQRPPEQPKPPLLMNIHDDISIRDHHLHPTYDLDPEQTERAMLKLLPLAQQCRTVRPSSAVARARAARLQELIHFCATSGLSPSGENAYHSQAQQTEQKSHVVSELICLLFISLYTVNAFSRSLVSWPLLLDLFAR